ncbi:MAG: ABC transporter permease [Gordonia sp. (in: high G+C Gram-positive bacteria)]
MTTSLDPVHTRPRAGTATRTSVGLVTATATLSVQKLKAAARSGDVVLAFLSPVVFFICFFVPLHRRFELTGLDYAQYLTPIILLQACLFTAIVATETAAGDARAGMRERLVSLPIPRSAPILSRMSWVLARLLITLAGGLLIGASLGFGFHGSIVDTLGFFVLVIVFGLSLSLFTDAIGSRTRNSAGLVSIMMIPELVAIMASTGLVPAESFPHWIQSFVRNQPLSVFAEALRGLASPQTPELTAVLVWSFGLLAAGWLTILWSGRAQVKR